MVIENKYRTMQESVYDTLKSRILNGHYSPGQRLITSSLANEFGISRMPVREALQRLEAATGLVKLAPHRGAIVNTVSERDIIDIFQMRGVLEGLAGRLACGLITAKEIDQLEKTNRKLHKLRHDDDEEKFLDMNREFHSLIWKAADAPRLADTLRMLYDASKGYRYMSLSIPGRLDEVVSEHDQVISAFREGNAAEVEKCLKTHYQKTLDWLMKPHDKRSQDT